MLPAGKASALQCRAALRCLCNAVCRQSTAPCRAKESKCKIHQIEDDPLAPFRCRRLSLLYRFPKFFSTFFEKRRSKRFFLKAFFRANRKVSFQASGRGRFPGSESERSRYRGIRFDDGSRKPSDAEICCLACLTLNRKQIAAARSEQTSAGSAILFRPYTKPSFAPCAQCGFSVLQYSSLFPRRKPLSYFWRRRQWPCSINTFIFNAARFTSVCIAQAICCSS